MGQIYATSFRQAESSDAFEKQIPKTLSHSMVLRLIGSIPDQVCDVL